MDHTFGDTMSVSKRTIGGWIEHLSGSELKVALFLALRTNGFRTPLEGVRNRDIANATNLKKKEVKSALRVLAIKAAFGARFTEPSFFPFDAPSDKFIGG